MVKMQQRKGKHWKCFAKPAPAGAGKKGGPAMQANLQTAYFCVNSACRFRSTCSAGTPP